MVNMNIDCIEICQSTRCGKCAYRPGTSIKITLGEPALSDFRALAGAAQTSIESYVRKHLMEMDSCRRVRRGDVPIIGMEGAA